MQNDTSRSRRETDEGGCGLLNSVATFLCLAMFVLILAGAVFLMFHDVSVTVDPGGNAPIPRN